MIPVFTPACKIDGFEEITFVRSVPEIPYLFKTLILRKSVFWGLLKRIDGDLVTSLVIWASVKPWFLNSSITESGFLGFLRFGLFEAERADSGDNPHEFTR
ncbi:hypothetical protein MRB53_000583 [Persea americana]|uniref:Uncharacterized protein n=1 Tax=Persea americana TaxID=3435 RepID=A0ACC2MPD9_PERAE|nr:hypothetical protein MRB53_000583 [Persea americana]